MNPYFASRLADDRLARDRVAAGDLITAGPPGSRAVTAASAGTSGVRHRSPGRRVRRVAGWLLIDAGLRLAVGRPPTLWG